MALSAASFLPKYLPHFCGLFLTSATLRQGKKWLGGKGNSFVCLVLCHLVSVPSGYEDYPKMTLFLQRWHFLSKFFPRSTPSASTYSDYSSLLQTALLWLSAFDNSLKSGLLVVSFPIGEQEGKIPFQMITGQCFLWIPLYSLKHTTLCLLYMKGHFTPSMALQTSLQLCLQPSHWQGSDPSPSSWDSWRQVLGGLLEVLLIWFEVRGEHTSPWPHVKVGGRERPFQRKPHLPIFSTSISLYCQGQWWVHERQSIYTLSRSRVTWEYWLPIVLISALGAWPKMKREVPFEYLVSLDFISNN